MLYNNLTLLTIKKDRITSVNREIRIFRNLKARVYNDMIISVPKYCYLDTNQQPKKKYESLELEIFPNSYGIRILTFERRINNELLKETGQWISQGMKEIRLRLKVVTIHQKASTQ